MLGQQDAEGQGRRYVRIRQDSRDRTLNIQYRGNTAGSTRSTQLEGSTNTAMSNFGPSSVTTNAPSTSRLSSSLIRLNASIMVRRSTWGRCSPTHTQKSPLLQDTDLPRLL